MGQVYFSPECHARYAALGFNASPGTTAGGVALPDGPAYFTSRGSALGQAPGELVAAAFGVFNPEAVVPSVTFGWSLTDAATIADERLAGAVEQLERILGPAPDGIDRANELLGRAVAPLEPVGPGPVRRHALPAPARHAAGRPVPARRPAARVPRRQPHRRVGGGRARRHRDRAAHRALLGHAAAHLHPHPGVERRRSSTPPRRASTAAGHLEGGTLTDAGRALREADRAGHRRPDGPRRRRPRRRPRRAGRPPRALGHRRHGRRRLPPSPLAIAPGDSRSPRRQPARAPSALPRGRGRLPQSDARSASSDARDRATARLTPRGRSPARPRRASGRGCRRGPGR